MNVDPFLFYFLNVSRKSECRILQHPITIMLSFATASCPRSPANEISLLFQLVKKLFLSLSLALLLLNITLKT